MEDDQAPHPMATQSQRKAREILDKMFQHRIDPRTIKTETAPSATGGQGTVTRGTVILLEEVATWRPEQLPKQFMRNKLAIKKLEWNRENAEASAKFFKSFVNELSVMARVSHPNIVKLIGFVEDEQKGDAWIVIPWEENGNVRDFLRSGEWDIPERVSLVQDIINGVEYLHTRQPLICHGDLKSLNILVNSSYHAVITDFGSARFQQNVDATTRDSRAKLPHLASNDDMAQASASPKVKLNPSTLELTLTGAGYSIRWTAPEVVRDGPGAQDSRSDMWAIGWICWEIFTGRLPFEEIHAMGPVICNIVKGKLPPIQEDADLSHILRLCSLMSDCWISDPVKRIDASTFRRRARFIPSTTPSFNIAGSGKIRSAALLQELGTMYRLQDNTVMAAFHYESAIETADLTKDDRAKANALDGLGMIYRAQSKYQEAEKAFSEAHEIYSRIGNDLGAANALRGLGNIYRAQSRNLEAERALMKAHQIHSRIGDLSAANALDGLGEIYRAQSRNAEAEKAFMEAHAIHSRIGNDLGEANSLVGLGDTYRAQSRHREAEKALMEAHEIFSRVGNDVGAANALAGLGNTYHAQSRYREAEKAFVEAHEIFSRVGNDLGAANSLVGLGDTYRAQSRYREAENAFMEAHEIFSRVGNDLGTANALIGLGDTYRARSRNPEAEKAFVEAGAIHSRIGNNFGAAKSLVGLGETYRAQSRYAEAEKTFMEAHEAYSRFGSDLGTANALIGLGHTYRAQARNPEAEKAFADAHNTYSRIGDHLGNGNALCGLASLYSDQCKFSDAEASLLQAVASYDRAGGGGSKAMALLALGKNHQTQCRYPEAEEAVMEALTIWRSISDEEHEADALLLLSQISTSQSRLNEEKEALTQAEAALASTQGETHPGVPTTIPDISVSTSEDGTKPEVDAGDENVPGASQDTEEQPERGRQPAVASQDSKSPKTRRPRSVETEEVPDEESLSGSPQTGYKDI